LQKIKEGVSKRVRRSHDKEGIKKLHTCGCSAIKIYVTNLLGGFNEQLEKEKVLLPTTSPRSAVSHDPSVLCHQIEDDIINGNVDTNRIKLKQRLNGEGGRRHPRIALHQQLNVEFQHL
jgi:hypothetical protein